MRLVMPAAKDPDPLHIEIKIESFFEATQDLFIETQFVWPQPRLLKATEKFDAGYRLTSVEEYAIKNVCDFLLKPETEE